MVCDRSHESELVVRRDSTDAVGAVPGQRDTAIKHRRVDQIDHRRDLVMRNTEEWERSPRIVRPCPFSAGAVPIHVCVPPGARSRNAFCPIETGRRKSPVSKQTYDTSGVHVSAISQQFHQITHRDATAMTQPVENDSCIVEWYISWCGWEISPVCRTCGSRRRAKPQSRLCRPGKTKSSSSSTSMPREGSAPRYSTWPASVPVVHGLKFCAGFQTSRRAHRSSTVNV